MAAPQASPFEMTLAELLTDVDHVSSYSYSATVFGVRIVIRNVDGKFECWANRPHTRGGFIASEGTSELEVIQCAALYAQLGSIK